MSDTPRTDKAVFGFTNRLVDNDTAMDYFDMFIEHSRQLERELAAMTKERDNMIQKAAEKHLGGYRELSEQLVQALNERDEARNALKEAFRFALWMSVDELKRWRKAAGMDS